MKIVRIIPLFVIKRINLIGLKIYVLLRLFHELKPWIDDFSNKIINVLSYRFEIKKLNKNACRLM